VNRLRPSPIVGYLLAGVLVGPFTPGFVADRPTAEHRDAVRSHLYDAPDAG